MPLTPILIDAETRRDQIHRKAVEGVTDVFPLAVKDHTIEVANLRVDPRAYSSRQQKEAILHGRTLQEPLKGDLVLKNSAGKTVQQRKDTTLAQLPYFTQRHTFIVDGNEYSVANQRRVRPGVYTRIRGNEELEAAFNLGKGENFRVNMDPAKGHMFLQYGSTNIPMYPVLKRLGVSDKELDRAWGHGVVAQNRTAFAKKEEQSLDKLYTRLVPEFRREATTLDEKADAIKASYRDTMMDPSVTARTLGTPYEHVTPDTLVKASQKLLDVHRQGIDTDDRDSLAYQSLHSVDDFVKERLQLEGRNLARKVRLKSGQTLDLDKLVPGSPFTKTLRNFATTSSLASIPTQINPIEILDSAVRITSLGEGGIGSERAVPREARRLHNTHFGVIDPSRTPESYRAGIDLRASLFTKRDAAGRFHTVMRNAKTGRLVDVPVHDLEKATIAFPGESKKSRGISAMREGQLVSVGSKQVDYELPHPSYMFSPATNTVPMPESMQGNRLIMGSKMATQALPLVDREVPHIQVESYNLGRSFEQELGRLVSPHAPVDGIIRKIDEDYIYLEPTSTKRASADDEPELLLMAPVEHVLMEKTAGAAPLIKIHYDTDFPLASKTYLNNDITVKVGDKVKAHQPLAESNFTRNGTLALGKNLNVGMLAYYGMNSNDAVVVSESGSQKLTSEHMYKEAMPLDDDIVLNKNKHRALFGNRWTAAQYDDLDERGIAKPGAKVMPGDPLIVALRKTAPSPEQQMLGRLHKTLATPFREQVTTWEHRNGGTVIDVVVTPQRVLLTVKTREAAGIGDKLCFSEDTEVLTKDGWKDVADITINDVLYTLRDNHIELHEAQEVHHYPTAGEVYELKSQQVDLRVTPNHHLYVQLRGADKHTLLEAREVIGKRCRHQKNGHWHAETPAVFSLPTLDAADTGKGCKRQQAAADRHVPIPTKAWLRFLGAYIANGSYLIHDRKSRPGTVDYRVNLHTIRGITHSVSGDQHTWIQGILDECGFAYTTRDDRLVINSKQLTQYVAQFGHAKDKHVPTVCFTWGAVAAQWLLEGLLGCDGYLTASNSLGYTTVSPQLADDVQRLALHRGWSANIKTYQPSNPRWSLRYTVHMVQSKNTPQVNHGHSATQKAQSERIIRSNEPVYGITVPNSILYVRVNGKPVWTGNSGRFGNKGVISKIIPDQQMIQDQSGKPLDVLMTSAGVVSRVNPVQIIEMAAGKVAAKTGKPIIIPSMSGRNNVKWARGLLKEHGLTDKEIVYNPVTDKVITGPDGKGVMVGPQYIYKLFKSTETNYSARGVEDYDVNLQPAKGGATGAKALGRMEINALLAHDARNVLKEAGSIKSSRNDEWWRAYQLGLPLPPMRQSFVADKFANMLQGAGIKMDKSNEQVRLGPLTDQDITKLSSGAIRKSTMVREKDLAPEKGGLFDPIITGGTSGTRWSHVDLAEPIVNPTFADPVRRLLNLNNTQMRQAIRQGGKGIQKELRAIDMPQRRRELEAEIREANGSRLDDALKQLKTIKALERENLTPDKAYMMSKLPVVPPVVRPILPSRGRRDLLVSDANYLYRDNILANDALTDAKKSLPDKEVGDARMQLYDATRATFGLADPVSPQLQGRKAKGFITTIAGQGSPKHGFFHGKVLYRPQDLSGRGTAIPDLNLNMDEIGLPEEMLWTTYAPHIMRRLVQGGHKAVDAKKLIEDRHPAAQEALRRETKERPVFVNRAPTLHRYSIIGAYPVPVPGKTIRVNPFIEKGMGLDYDGDALQIHSPVTPKAVEEVKAMTLSNLLFGDKTKSDLLVFPQHEAIMGIHHASKAGKGKTKHRFKNQAAALEAYKQGKIGLTDFVQIG